VYRFERGELVKIETLEKLSELLGVSIPTLLGVGVEYLPSAVAYFERIRQVEETASHIIVLAGPISYLLASPAFHRRLAGILSESIPDSPERKRALSEVAQIMAILAQRKETYARRRPSVVNLLAASEVGRLLQNGLTGRFDLPERQRRERRAHARAEVEHLVKLMEDEPIDVQIGIVPDTLPHAGFQIFRQPDREVLSISPFRLGEHPNVRVGVAMLTSAPEALVLHHRTASAMWRRASKGAAAIKQMKALLRQYKK
jgi:transcriptional regulator with XRE-family HTH domain